MTNTKIHKGDKVIVIAGKDRNKTGKVEKVLIKNNRAIITGVNIVKKHLKRSTDNPQGGIVDKTLSIHLSNVMVLDPKTDKPTRVSYGVSGKEKIRVAKRSGDIIKRERK